AAGYVAEQARKHAANLLEAALDDIVLDTDSGHFHVAGTPSISKTWAEVAVAAHDAGEELACEGDFASTSGTYPSGAHLVVVEVDTETGNVHVVRVVAVDDAGII